MERDPLEQFVEVHRASFDQALPDHDLWSQIEQQLPSDTPVVEMRRPRVFQLMKYAAAVIAIVSVSVFSTMQYMKSSSVVGVSAEVINEINELTDYYDFQVKRKLSQLAAYETDANANVNEELSNIDDVISQLKIELDEVPTGSEEKVINAMISNFKLKVLILETMLEAKENNLNNTENRDDEINI